MYLRWFVNEADSLLTIELDDLQPSTLYTVTFSTELLLGGTNILQQWSWRFTTGTVREFPVPNAMDRPVFTMTDHFPPSLTYDITWDEVPGASSYELQEETSEVFDGGGTTYTTSDTFYTINKSGSNQYYYRVRAFDGSTFSDWSRIFYIQPSE